MDKNIRILIDKIYEKYIDFIDARGYAPNVMVIHSDIYDQLNINEGTMLMGMTIAKSSVIGHGYIVLLSDLGIPLRFIDTENDSLFKVSITLGKVIREKIVTSSILFHGI